MSALADVLVQAGWTISGSDLAIPESAACAAWITPHAHPLQRVGPSETASHTSPATRPTMFRRTSTCSSTPAPSRPDNPELRRAAELGIPTLSYAEMLGQLMAGRRGLAVAGTHGKSTTAAMAAHILVQRGPGSDGRGRRHPAGGRFRRAFRTRRPGAGRSLRISRQFPPPAAATRRHPGHRARSFRLLRFARQLEAAFAAIRRAGSDRTACCSVRGDCPATRRAAARRAAARKPSPSRPSADWSARKSLRPGRPLPL